MATVSTRDPHGNSRVLRGFEHINRYWDNKLESNVAKILPGEYYVTSQDEHISTILGSCVAACVRDRVFGIGGMNHFMLPVKLEDDPNSKFTAAERYGNFAMEHLINDILKHGGRRENLEVKVFGGGRILTHMTDVGKRNIEFVKDYIRTEHLTLAAEDLGDIFPRKIIYHPLTGRVRLKKLKSLHNQTIIQRESTYLEDLRKDPVEGEVDLF